MQFQGSGNCSTPCPAPTSKFTYSDNFLSVNFDASLSTGTLLTYSWDFGDGNNGTGAAPTHVYATGGTYFVTLTATDSCNQSKDFKDTLTVCDELNLSAISYAQSVFNVNFDASGVSEAIARKMIQAARSALDMGFESGVELLERRKKVGKITTGSNNFDKIHDFQKLAINSKVPVLVGYCLRHSDSLNKLGELLSNNVVGDVSYVRIESSSYLPNWRPDSEIGRAHV